ncbi:MAG: heptaprenyl diphosphate synthase component 1 [Bacillus sp. (in: firmicutes)]
MELIYNHTKNLHNHIVAKAFHPYLRRFLQEPPIDDKKILLLVALLNDLPISEEERDQYITATMLVQVALDIHDQVEPEKTVANDNLKQRQLTILAGDYYSGLYYYILARLENVELIRLLAEGIKDINEHKMLYHQRNFPDEESLLHSIATIESSLILKVGECFQTTHYHKFIKSFLLLNRLQKERSEFFVNKNSFLYDVFAQEIYSKETVQLNMNELEHVHSVIKNHIHSTYLECEKSLKILSSNNEEWNAIFQCLLKEDEWEVNSIVEEG